MNTAVDEANETRWIFDYLRQRHATDKDLLFLVQYVERMLREYVPDAKLLVTTDRQGRTTHAAIYNAPLVLNQIGQFRPLQQYAPQRLSKMVEYKWPYHTTLRLKVEFDLWMDALFVVASRVPTVAQRLNSEIQCG